MLNSKLYLEEEKILNVKKEEKKRLLKLLKKNQILF